MAADLTAHIVFITVIVTTGIISYAFLIADFSEHIAEIQSICWISEFLFFTFNYNLIHCLKLLMLILPLLLCDKSTWMSLQICIHRDPWCIVLLLGLSLKLCYIVILERSLIIIRQTISWWIRDTGYLISRWWCRCEEWVSYLRQFSEPRWVIRWRRAHIW